MTCKCQEQTEQVGGAEKEISEHATVHKSEKFQFYPNYNKKPFGGVAM